MRFDFPWIDRMRPEDLRRWLRRYTTRGEAAADLEIWVWEPEGYPSAYLIAHEQGKAHLVIYYPVELKLAARAPIPEAMRRLIDRAAGSGLAELRSLRDEVAEALYLELVRLEGFGPAPAVVRASGIHPEPCSRETFEWNPNARRPSKVMKPGALPAAVRRRLEADARGLGLLVAYLAAVESAIDGVVWTEPLRPPTRRGGRPPLPAGELARTVRVLLELRRRFPKASEVRLREKAEPELNLSPWTIRHRLQEAYSRFFPEADGELTDPDNLQELLERIERGEEADLF
jgi:hypothetical protein